MPARATGTPAGIRMPRLVVSAVVLAFTWIAWAASTGPGAAPVRAADLTFVVNSLADTGASGSTADGVCDTGAVIDGVPECTLRAAIEEANGVAGADTVDATGVTGTIQLAAELHITDDVEVLGPGAGLLMVRGGGTAGDFPVILLTGIDEATIAGVTVTNGGLTSTGGLTVFAAGIVNFSNGSLNLDGVAVADNHTEVAGSGAGGIASSGDLRITGSTISGNTAVGSFAFGGAAGILMANNRDLEIRNSTIGANEIAGGASPAGGVRGNGSVTLDSVTFAENSATGSGSPASDFWGGPSVTDVEVRNTIFGSFASPNCFFTADIASLGNNLERGANASCGLDQPTDLAGVDPVLGALGAHGGPMPTYALASGSPAVDAGSTALPTDQRGVPRPQGTAPDIGAFELDDTPPDTIIDGGAADGDVVPTGTVEFAFHATEPASTFECRLDGPGGVGSFVPCTSPDEVAVPVEGEYSFSVRARDLAGNVDPEPATVTFTVAAATDPDDDPGDDAEAPGSDPAGELPRTGADPTGALIPAAALVLAGAALLARVRRHAAEG